MIDVDALAWDKMDGLLPAVVQDADSGEVRMIGYMNREALGATIADGFVTFFSRSRQQLGRKGESSGDTLALLSVTADCDGDALLVIARPNGPTCHTGTTSCFGNRKAPGVGFVADLERILVERATADPATSYTARLVGEGIKRIAQKVGEEGVETVIAALNETENDLINEASDLIFHLLVLLKEKNISLETISRNLEQRHVSRPATQQEKQK